MFETLPLWSTYIGIVAIILLSAWGGIKFAAPKLGSEPVLFHNVDVLTNINLEEFYQSHIERGGLASLAVKERPTSRHLLFNQRVFWRSKAAVFLGDAGSMMLGLGLVWATIALSQGEYRAITPAAALWFLMVPVCDTVSVSVRRIRAGKSPFHADSRHLHHLFMQVGFSVLVNRQ